MGSFRNHDGKQRIRDVVRHSASRPRVQSPIAGRDAESISAAKMISLNPQTKSGQSAADCSNSEEETKKRKEKELLVAST